MSTESEARAILPKDAVWSSSFGQPGNGGFNEYYRRPDGERWVISNGRAMHFHLWDFVFGCLAGLAWIELRDRYRANRKK